MFGYFTSLHGSAFFSAFYVIDKVAFSFRYDPAILFRKDTTDRLGNGGANCLVNT